MQSDVVRRAAWWWLAIPVMVSGLGWFTVPQALLSAPSDAEGVGILMELAGLLAAGLTVPVTIVILYKIGALGHTSIEKYCGIIFAVALPDLAFLFCFTPMTALAFVSGILYAVIVFATHAIAERSPGAAAFAGFAIPGVLAAGLIGLTRLL